MSDVEKYRAYLLSGDSPLKDERLKRYLLFFDSIAVSNPEDGALINDGDVVEEFPNMKIVWGPRACFPRTEGYAEAMAVRDFIKWDHPISS